jgi:hypothetical protein
MDKRLDTLKQAFSVSGFLALLDSRQGRRDVVLVAAECIARDTALAGQSAG